MVKYVYLLFGLGSGAILWTAITTSKSHALPFVLMAGLLTLCVATALLAWAKNPPTPTAKEEFNARGDSHIDIG